MSIIVCQWCDAVVDTDYNAEHEEYCGAEEGPGEDQGFYDDDPNEERP